VIQHSESSCVCFRVILTQSTMVCQWGLGGCNCRMKMPDRFGFNMGCLAGSIMQRLLLAVMDCVEDGLEAARHMQFPKNTVYIGVDGLLAYEELIADFLVRATGGEVRENFAFSWRQHSPMCLNFIMDRKSNHYVSRLLRLSGSLYPCPCCQYFTFRGISFLTFLNQIRSGRWIHGNRLNPARIGSRAHASA
jgi:hypothetical protein